jgi:two-component system NarL family sensor kinase
MDVILVAPYQLDWYGLMHPFYAGAFSYGEDLSSLVFVLVIPAYATLGAVIVALRPNNSIGWLCFVPSLLMVAVGWPPGLGSVADLMQSLAWYLMVPPLPITLMLLIFPDGRLLSRRWWTVLGIAS